MWRGVDGYSPDDTPWALMNDADDSFGREAVAKTGDEQKKLQESAVESLSLICGQKAVLTRAKNAISTFKFKKGLPVAFMAAGNVVFPLQNF